MSQFTSACLNHNSTRLHYRAATYGADFLHHHTDKMIAELKSLGFRSGDIISYQSRNNPFLFPLLMVADTLHGVVLCLDDRLTPSEITSAEQRLRPQFRFSHNELTQDYGLTASHLPRQTEKLHAEFEKLGGGIFNLTSGTTGPASLIFHDFNQTLESLRFPANEQKISAASRTLSYLSYTHSGGLLLQTLPTLIQGGTLEIEHLSNLKNFFSSLASCTHLILVPSVYQTLKKLGQLPTLQTEHRKTIITGSSTVPPELFRDLTPANDVLNVYGLTEITPFLFRARTFLTEIADGTLAGPIISSHEYILTDEGEVAVKGPLVGRVYNPATEELTSLGSTADSLYYRTGDLGRDTEHGLVLIGRKKMIINYRGFKFSPSEIESIAIQHPNVLKCAVKKGTDSSGDEYPALYIEMQDKTAAQKDFLTKLEVFLRQHLSIDKMPREFLIVDNLPETLIGKNDYGKIS